MRIKNFMMIALIVDFSGMAGDAHATVIFRPREELTLRSDPAVPVHMDKIVVLERDNGRMNSPPTELSMTNVFVNKIPASIVGYEIDKMSQPAMNRIAQVDKFRSGINAILIRKCVESGKTFPVAMALSSIQDQGTMLCRSVRLSGGF